MLDRPKIVLLIEPPDRFDCGFLRGVAKYSRLHGHWSFYRQQFSRKDAFPPLSSDSWHADGIIVREPKKIEEIVKMGVPTILAAHIEKPPRSLPSVITDCRSTGIMGAEHLLERRFQRFAFCGLDNMPWSRQRGASFRKRIAEAGFKTHFYKQPKSQANLSWEKEQTFIADWLKSLPKPVGLMTCDDQRGQNIIEACKIVGLQVPEQVAVIGVDNNELICVLSAPQLSSIAFNLERAGYEAAELLNKMMSGEKTGAKKIIIHPTHIVTRQSTDSLAIEDSQVAEAVRFIRQHSKQIIQVSDVVNATVLSRRALEQRFHSVFGYSVLDEIRRVRVKGITQMLVETDLSIAKIAFALGYTSSKHIARYFHQEKGMNPSAYRQKYGRK